VLLWNNLPKEKKNFNPREEICDYCQKRHQDKEECEPLFMGKKLNDQSKTVTLE